LSPCRESYESATSWVLDTIAYNFIVRRNSIYPPSIEEYNDAEKGKNLLYTVRYVIQVLRSKSLIFLIPKRFVINIPLVLTYYRLHNDSIEMVYEGALRRYLSYNDAENLAESLVRNYMPLYMSLIDELLRSAHLYLKIIGHIDWDKVIEIVHQYIPYIISGDEAKPPRSITEEFRDHISSFVSRKIINEFRYSWGKVFEEIDRLCFHKDSHVESICRRFLNRVVRYTLYVLFPSYHESKSIFMLSFREEVILCLIKSFGSISKEDLINILYLLKKEKNIDLGYIFMIMGEYIICKQALNDIKSLLSRGFLEEIEGKLNVSALGQHVLEKKGCTEKVKRIAEEARELLKNNTK